MSHHDHDHHHGHDHHHDPIHDHHHGHASGQGSLPFDAKLVKLLDHWVQHNDHHAEDYRKWARDARAHGHPEVADLLASAAELTDRISDRFREAGAKVT